METEGLSQLVTVFNTLFSIRYTRFHSSYPIDSLPLSNYISCLHPVFHLFFLHDRGKEDENRSGSGIERNSIIVMTSAKGGRKIGGTEPYVEDATRSFLLSSLFALVCHMARNNRASSTDAAPSPLPPSSRLNSIREFRLSTSVSSAEE